MLSQAIWWSGVAIEILILVRGFLGKLAPRYPVFYGYITFVLLQSIPLFVAYHWQSPLYRNIYWSAEFLSVVLGSLVVFEFYRIGLSGYPGTARMARNALAVVFASAFVKALADVANDSRWWLEATARDVEVALRTVQAVSLVALVVLFLFYSIPFGKNLRGILLGYGLFVAVSVLSMTLTAAGVRSYRDFWAYLFPVSYLVTLGVWATHLWSYQPSPVPREAVRIEQEYQRVAAATHRRLQEARGYLAKAVRP